MESSPILEYDPALTAIIEPVGPALTRPAPSRAVLCFFQEVLQALLGAGRLEKIGAFRSELGESPIYVLQAGSEAEPCEVLVTHPGVGAPLAAGIMEEMLALGVRQVIACGSCGVLHPELAAGHPVVLTAAVRDEGTSFHYLPPSREAYPHPRAVAALEAACQSFGIDYRLGKSWTTDAFYRETAARRQRRLDEGCDVVEMEASAFFAVAQFRGIVFGQIVYSGDLVVPEGWDHRGWHKRTDDRDLLFRLALDACLRLE